MWELFGDSDHQFRVVSAVRAPRGGGLEVFGLAEDGSVWQNLSRRDDGTRRPLCLAGSPS
jgi:hypothetical protein